MNHLENKINKAGYKKERKKDRKKEKWEDIKDFFISYNYPEQSIDNRESLA